MAALTAQRGPHLPPAPPPAEEATMELLNNASSPHLWVPYQVGR